MPENAPPITFTREDTGQSVRLQGPDMPGPPLHWGGKVEKSETLYPSGEASVQVHGVKYEPVVLEGTIDDTKWGSDGHAAQMASDLLALMEAGSLVRMDYGPDSRWGVFAVVLEETRRDRISYKIRFEPYWMKAPELQNIMNFQPPPADEGEMVISGVEALRDQAAAAPDSVDGAPLSFPDGGGEPTSGKDGPSFAMEIYLASATALNKHADAMGVIDSVVSYAEFGADQARYVIRRLTGSARAIGRMRARLKTAALGDYAPGQQGVASLRAVLWKQRTEARARRAQADLRAWLRKWLAGLRPITNRTHVVGEGDTLMRLARVYLGEWSRWTEIADANDLDTDGELTVGQILEVPPR